MCSSPNLRNQTPKRLNVTTKTQKHTHTVGHRHVIGWWAHHNSLHPVEISIWSQSIQHVSACCKQICLPFVDDGANAPWCFIFDTGSADLLAVGCNNILWCWCVVNTPRTARSMWAAVQAAIWSSETHTNRICLHSPGSSDVTLVQFWTGVVCCRILQITLYQILYSQQGCRHMCICDK